MVLETGTEIEPIVATNQWDERVRVEFDRPTVVYFYPRDETPGCTTEAKQFNEIYEGYDRAGIEVYGVSPDGVDAHCEFAQRHDLAFDLLADSDGDISTVFDVPVTDGRAARTTFVIAGQRIVAVYEGVRPDGHARQVLRDLAGVGIVQT